MVLLFLFFAREQSPVVCDINLSLNGSDYEIIDFLNENGTIQRFKVSNIRTTHGKQRFVS